MCLTDFRRCGVIASAQVPPGSLWLPVCAGPNGLLSHIIWATLWRSPMRLEGTSVRLAMGDLLGGLPPAAAVSLMSPQQLADAQRRPGSRPVGAAGWALWTFGLWLILPPSIWG